MPFTTRTNRLLTRIAISTIVLAVFAMHVSSSPRFKIIDRMENYFYDVRVRAAMPGGFDGIKVVQLTSPDSQPNFYNFSPLPKPELIASYPTRSPVRMVTLTWVSLRAPRAGIGNHRRNMPRLPRG